jgi:chromosome segregation ATPase
MIDEKINKALTELETNLKNLESAREQVEITVSSYNGLNSTTAKYVNELGTITTKIQNIVDTIGKDYSKNIKAFEDDRQAIINAATAATEKLSNATEEFKDSLVKIQTKLKYSLIVNAFSFIALAAILFFLLK